MHLSICRFTLIWLGDCPEMTRCLFSGLILLGSRSRSNDFCLKLQTELMLPADDADRREQNILQNQKKKYKLNGGKDPAGICALCNAAPFSLGSGQRVKLSLMTSSVLPASL